MSIADQFILARGRGVPLIAISTPDAAATMVALVKASNGEHPAVAWDLVRGLHEPPGCKYGLAEAMAGENDPTKLNPVALLEVIVDKAPDRSVIFMQAADRCWSAGDATMIAATVQGIWNCRDPFKARGRGITLVMLCSDVTLPVELKNSVLVIDEPLPGAEQLGEIVDEIVKQTKKGHEEFSITPVQRDAAIGRVRGLDAYAAEQSLALALRKDGIDLKDLWDKKRKIINQTKGLSVDVGSETFSEIGGQGQAKRFGRRLFEGPQPPLAVVRVEEIEKVMAGASGDLSGTSQDALQVLLNSMEDHSWAGLIAFGPPGSGKSLFSKSLANSFGAMSLTFDLNATKGSLVGESERSVRDAVRVIEAIGGKDVFFVATCNRLDTLPPELRRRFRYGTWMFDLPDAEERAGIWEINRVRFGVQKKHKLPDDSGYTGADIRNVCELSHKLDCSLVEATQYIAPVSRTSPETIDAARKLAHQRFLSASQPGLYCAPGREERIISKDRLVEV